MVPVVHNFDPGDTDKVIAQLLISVLSLGSVAIICLGIA